MPMALVPFDKSHDDIEPPAGLEQRGECRIVCARTPTEARDEILEDIAGQRKLGKDNQIGALLLRLADQVEVLFKVGVNVAETGVDLRQGESESGHPASWIVIARGTAPPAPARRRGVSRP